MSIGVSVVSAYQVKRGDAFQLPGGNVTVIALDDNLDGIIDGLDYNYDGEPENIVVLQGNKQYMVYDKSKELLFFFKPISKQQVSIQFPGEGGKEHFARRIELWHSMQVTVGGGGSYPFLNLNQGTLWGYHAFIGFDTGVDHWNFIKNLTGGFRKLYIPGIHGRIGGQINENQNVQITRIYGLLGPMFRIPAGESAGGQFAFTPMAGPAFMLIKAPEINIQSLAVMAQFSLAYLHPLSFLTLRGEIVTSMIADQSSFIFEVGLNLGVSYGF